MELSADHNRVSGAIVDSAFAVHQALGPYSSRFTNNAWRWSYGLATLPWRSKSASRSPIAGRRLTRASELDLVVEDLVVVEVKAAERLLPVHDAQLLTYLKLSGRRLGLLINLNVPRIKEGIKRPVLSE